MDKKENDGARRFDEPLTYRDDEPIACVYAGPPLPRRELSQIRQMSADSKKTNIISKIKSWIRKRKTTE